MRPHLCRLLAVMMLTATLGRGYCQDPLERNPNEPAPRVSPKHVEGADQPVRWPMRLAKQRPVPVIEAVVNGQGPFLFYLDTGASTATLDTAFVEKMKLPIRGKTAVRAPGGPGVEADIVAIESLEIGGVRFLDFEGVAFDRSRFSGGEDLAGSLGLPLFGDLPLTINYPESHIVIGGDQLAETDGKTVLDCNYDGRLPSFAIVLGDVTVDCHLDTGSSGYLAVSDKLAEGLKFSSEPTVVGRGRTISGEFEIKSAPLDGDLVVGDLVASNPNVALLPNLNVSVLGYPWAKDLAITFDAKNKRVSFVRPEKTQH